MHLKIDVIQKSGHLGFKILDPSKRTRVAKRVNQEKLGVVLPPRIDSIGVVSVNSDVDWLAAWSFSIVSARFSQNRGISEWVPWCGACLYSTVPDGVLI